MRPDQPWWTWPLVVAGLSGILTGIWAIINRKGGERFQQNTLLPPTWDTVYARLDALDARVKERDERIEALSADLDELNRRMVARDRAFGNVLAAAARAWPANSPGPTFARVDLEVLGDTIPSVWLKNIRTG
jgi:hypothetical protein